MNLPTSKIKTSTRRGSLYAYPREKSINHFKEQIRRLTRRHAPVSTQELIQQVNPVVRGWGHHYKRAQVRKLFHRLDGWLVRRIWSVVCVKFSKLGNGRRVRLISAQEFIPLFDRTGPSLRRDLPCGSAPRAAAVKDAAAKAAAPAQPAHRVLDRASTVLD